jgi:hypothetical protein
MKTFMCHWCAQSFHSREPIAKYCSVPHAILGSRQIPRPEQKFCKVCGTQIIIRDPNNAGRIVTQEFCSPRCARRWQTVTGQHKAMSAKASEKRQREAAERREHQSADNTVAPGQPLKIPRIPRERTRWEHLKNGREFAQRLLPKSCAICDWHEDVCDAAHLDDHTLVMLCPNHHRLLDRGKLPMSVVLSLSEKGIKYKPAQ